MNRMTIRELGKLVLNDWKKPHHAAVPYISAMLSLHNIKDQFGSDGGKEPYG